MSKKNQAKSLQNPLRIRKIKSRTLRKIVILSFGFSAVAAAAVATPIALRQESESQKTQLLPHDYLTAKFSQNIVSKNINRESAADEPVNKGMIRAMCDALYMVGLWIYINL